MKKLILALIAVLSITLTACSALSSKRIEPKIIGTTFLQEDRGLIFAEFSSVRYIPTIIYTGEKVGRDGAEEKVEPSAGMQVTCFISNIHKEPVFFAGHPTVEQIEQYYQKNYSLISVCVAVVFGLLFILTIHVAAKEVTTEVPTVNADV